MVIEFVFIGKTTEKWVEESCSKYLSRIKRYIKADIKIISSPSSELSSEIQKKKEAIKTIEKISPKDIVILLDEKGKGFTSTEFAGLLNTCISSGKSKTIFIVGGAYGSDILLQQRADIQLSFSNMTFTHQMMRTLLLEQVYRGFTILKNEKYHH
jgi:23S rRNA (pseudouridine1915-N3)-methyltransferase